MKIQLGPLSNIEINSPNYWDFLCGILEDSSATLLKFSKLAASEEAVGFRELYGDPAKHEFYAVKLQEIINALKTRPDYVSVLQKDQHGIYPDEAAEQEAVDSWLNKNEVSQGQICDTCIFLNIKDGYCEKVVSELGVSHEAAFVHTPEHMVCSKWTWMRIKPAPPENIRFKDYSEKRVKK